MERILIDLNKTPGIQGCFLVDSDGIIILSDFATDVNDEMMGALASSIINTTSKVVEKLNHGELQSFTFETDKSKLFFNNTKAGFLVAVTSPDANIGLIRMEMKSASEKINNISL